MSHPETGATPAGPATDFGAALRRLRTARGMSLTDLAAKVHYSRGYLSKIETGKSRASATLARVFDRELEAGGELARLAPAEPVSRAAAGGPAGHGTIRPLVRPFELPAAPHHFTGRAAELASLLRLLDDPAQLAEVGSVPVVVLHGMGGVGKTALAVVAAHRLDAAFPDGCLYVALHSYAADRPALSAGEALDTMLRRLGVPGEAIPERVDERAALYRSVLRDQRLLVVVDDARRADQVLPLIPSSAGCAVLVTSRRRLIALDDAYPVRLDPLPATDATSLFRAVAEVGGAEDAVEQVAEVVRSCGMLPLAIRIAASLQHGGGAAGLAGLARRLADPPTRLAELDDGERSTTAVLATSCADLPAPGRRLLALLTLHPAHEITAATAGWLGDLAPGSCRRELHGLADVHLLQPGRGAGRYQLHDLTRTYAAEVLLAAVPGAERTAARRRLVTAYLATAGRADALLAPHRYQPPTEPYDGAAPAGSFATAAEATAWFAAEADALAAACQLAADQGWHAACWQLAYVLRDHFFLTKAYDPWLATHRLALAAAERDGNEWAVAVTRNNLGLGLIERGHIRGAVEQYGQALPIFRRLGDARGEAATLGHLAWASYRGGDHAAVVRLGGQALTLYEDAGDERGVGITLRTLAMGQRQLGRVDGAYGNFVRALDLFRGLNLPHDAAMALNNLGGICAERGEFTRAARYFGEAIEQAVACDSTYEQARAYDGLAVTAAAAARPRAARHFADRATALYDTLHVSAADRAKIATVTA